MNMKLKKMAQELSVTKEKLTRRAYAVLAGYLQRDITLQTVGAPASPFLVTKINEET